MAKKRTFVSIRVVVGAVAISTASAFNTIFPLLWIPTQQQNRIGGSFLPLMPPFATLTKLTQKTDTDKMMEWLQNIDCDGGGKSSSFSSSVKVDTISDLRGLYATKNINKGEIIVEIPYNAALLVGDTLSTPIMDDFADIPGSEDWSEDDMDDVYQGLNFLQTFMKDVDYTPYVNTLPHIPSSGDEAGLTPDFWSKEVILGLQVSQYVKWALDRKQIVEKVAKKNPGVNEDELRWATWMMRSRRITTYNMVDDPDDEKILGVFPTKQNRIEQVQGFLIPLIDMANCALDPNAQLKISVNRWTRQFDETSTFALRALKPISKGEEVTILYGEGDRTSLDLLDKYGFFIEGNTADKSIDWEELKPEFTTSLKDDEAELSTFGNGHENNDESSKRDTLKSMVSKIQDYEPTFSSSLGDLLLIGQGLREKMGIKIYGVAMYGSAAVADATSNAELRNAARLFDATSSRTTFALEMILQADSKTVAEAIAESVKLRYGGSHADVEYLQTLIADGVKESGGQVTKGTILQFDCTEEGVSVSVNSAMQGTAKFKDLGSAFVDVFVDSDTVSPSLVENCIQKGSMNESSKTATNIAEPGPESRQTMLSLRVLMKRLSNWTMKDTVTQPAAATIIDKSISAPSAEVETQPQPVAAATADEVVVQDVASGGSEAETKRRYEAVERKMKPLKEKATGVSFDPKLEDGLYLVGAGVRKKAIINVYAVGMYSSPPALEALSQFPKGKQKKEAQSSLRDTARTFNEYTLTTSFVLEMTFKADGATIAEAIADGVKPRYSGSPSDVTELENLIIEGVKGKGGQATKGTIFRFDCTKEGVTVSVDGTEQGVANFDGIGSALVDVFMDDNAVSSQLVDSCLDTWPGSGLEPFVFKSAVPVNGDSKEAAPPGVLGEDLSSFDPDAIEAKIRELEAEIEKEVVRAKSLGAQIEGGASEATPQPAATIIDYGDIEQQAKSLKEKATGVSFDPKLEDGLYLVGVGVRKKAIINVYAVGMYSSPPALAALSQFPQGKQKKDAQSALRNAARTFGPSSPTTSFVLKMTFKADAATIAGAIADGVKPRYSGPPSDVKELESLIVRGVKSGTATKGTIFRFDCTTEGVKVSVDGNEQGVANFDGIGSALVDVFMDNKAVSPQLVESCLDTWLPWNIIF